MDAIIILIPVLLFSIGVTWIGTRSTLALSKTLDRRKREREAEEAKYRV